MRVSLRAVRCVQRGQHPPDQVARLRRLTRRIALVLEGCQFVVRHVIVSIAPGSGDGGVASLTEGEL